MSEKIKIMHIFRVAFLKEIWKTLRFKGIGRSLLGKSRLDDVLFIIGIFVFSTILILGLFPGKNTGNGVEKNFFFYSIMIVPVIVAIYFIVISFRRKLSSNGSKTTSSIRFKIALAFVFIAILPSLPIILISNNMISHMVTELISERTSVALEESIKMSRESIVQRFENTKLLLKSLDVARRQGVYSFNSQDGREKIKEFYEIRGYRVFFYIVENSGNFKVRYISHNPDGNDHIAQSIGNFLNVIDIREGSNAYNISIGNSSIILGTLYAGNHILALYNKIPDVVFSRISIFEDSLEKYRQREYMKPYFQTGAGVFLLILAILIIIGSIGLSLFLSKSITRPVFELEEAARKVASGNFDIKLRRESPDELALLFESFNKMVRQLLESRRVMFHTQKLEAWRDVARKLVHEIKNPLTPIRLSAERIQKRYKEGHPDIGEIVLNGTDTIIEEVNVLMKLLGEFTRFARLPEINPEYEEINPIVESCVNFFHGHEKIEFNLDMADSLPKINLDKVLIRQALTNIIQNSIDAVGDKGKISIKTFLQHGIDSKKVIITIRDDGMGISEEDLDKIFEPTYSTKPAGTGLGLTIVEKIVLEHQGKISCRSKQGKGTEFIIELPIFS